MVYRNVLTATVIHGFMKAQGALLHENNLDKRNSIDSTQKDTMHANNNETLQNLSARVKNLMNSNLEKDVSEAETPAVAEEE